MSRRVAIVGAGMGKFDKPREDRRVREMVAESVRMTFDFTPNLSKDDIDMGVASYFATHFDQEHNPASSCWDYMGMTPKPLLRIEGGGATGCLAIWAAWHYIKAGLADVILVYGLETQSTVDSSLANEFIASASDTDFDFALGGFYTGYYALMCARHYHLYNTNPVHTAMIAVKNKRNALNKPFAEFGANITVEDVLKSRMIASPLKIFDCCMLTDGAASVVLASEEKAKKLTDTPIWIAGAGSGSDAMRPGDRPIGAAETWGKGSKTPIINPSENAQALAKVLYPDIQSFGACREAARQAYKLANITNPIKQIHLAELHDAYTSSEMQTYEDIGFIPHGQTGKWVEEGGPFVDGDLPCNPSGGLIGVGHPVGATGIMSAFFAYHQLLGDEPKFCTNRSTEVHRAEKAVVHSHAGTGTYLVVLVLEK